MGPEECLYTLCCAENDWLEKPQKGGPTRNASGPMRSVSERFDEERQRADEERQMLINRILELTAPSNGGQAPTDSET